MVERRIKVINRIIHIIGGFILFWIVSWAWATHLPVTAFMENSGFTREGLVVQSKFTGYKIRECDRVVRSEVGWYRAYGVWEETSFKFIKDTSPNNTKPSGMWKQGFGIWQWGYVPTVATELRLTMLFDCKDNTPPNLEIVGVWPLSIK